MYFPHHCCKTVFPHNCCKTAPSYPKHRGESVISAALCWYSSYWNSLLAALSELTLDLHLHSPDGIHPYVFICRFVCLFCYYLIKRCKIGSYSQDDMRKEIFPACILRTKEKVKKKKSVRRNCHMTWLQCQKGNCRPVERNKGFCNLFYIDTRLK